MSLVLNVEILGEFKKLTQATEGAQGSLQKLQDGVGGIARGIGRTIGTLAVALGFTSIVQGFKDSVRAAEEAAVANQRIDAIAESMDLYGEQTKKTTDRIKEFADTQELQLGVDAEVIKATQAKLLTFKELALSAGTMGGAFDRATVLAQDLAAAGFGEATANATQLGKALNDPITGISSLTRVGIQFTEDQKKLIASLVESGDILSAQDVILKELEAQVGGTSAATVTSTERMTIAFGQVQEAIGTALLPVVAELSNYFVDMAPKIEAFFDELQDPTTELGEAWERLGSIFGHTTGEFGDLLAVFGLADITFTDVLNFVSTLTAGFGQLFFIVGKVAAIIGALIDLDIKKAFELSREFGTDYDAFVSSQNRALNPQQARQQASLLQAERNQNIVINNYAGNVTAQEIADKINRANRQSGFQIIREP